jgi:hypothetical protein
MNRIPTSIGVAAAALISLAASAEDFQYLTNTTRITWPEKQHLGVICNYRNSQTQVTALAKAIGDGYLITVVDARMADEAGAAAAELAKLKADYVVLMPQDQVFRDGTMATTIAIDRLASRGIPVIGTTPAALKQGAVFSVGDGTGGQILVSDHLIGTIDVNLPDRAMISQKSSLVLRREGMAAIRVHSGK